MIKICLITDSLSEGGAERMAANLSLILIIGIDVYLIALRDDIDYEFEGKLLILESILLILNG